MIQRGPIILTTAVALFISATAQTAQARSGQAAYHLHTSAMVTAARYEPRGSVLRVTNPQNGRSVVVTVNDRGPFNGNRILDLSTGAFRQLYGGLGRGVGPINYEVIRRGSELSSRGRRRSKSRRSGWSRSQGRRSTWNRGRHRGWSKRRNRR